MIEFVDASGYGALSRGGHLAGLTFGDRWLLAFSLAALLLLAGGFLVRRAARRARQAESGLRGLRRRAGALVALGPAIGLACAGGVDRLSVTVASGALVLGAIGVLVEHRPAPERAKLLVTLVLAIVAAVAGARFGPTGVAGLDALAAVVFVVVVTSATDGLGNTGSFALGMGATASFGLFATAGFAREDTLASMAVGLLGACVGFLAFNTRPASLFIGTGGRLAIGYTLAVGALAVRPAAAPAGAAGRLLTPLMLAGILVVDGALVVWSRLRRRRRLTAPRRDHLAHRLEAIGWTRTEAAAALVVGQAGLSIVTLFSARGVLPLAIGAGAALLVLVVLVAEASRARLQRRRPVGLAGSIRVGLVAIALALATATVPVAIVANDVSDLMESGRSAVSRALTAARDGDSVLALGAFRQAALTFARAEDKLDSPVLLGGLAIPGLAPNVRAARELAGIARDLARAGEELTAAVHPEDLEVVGGRVPLEEVRRITPELEAGSRALSEAVARLADVDDPYLVPQVSDALDKVDGELSQAETEAGRAVSAARLAPAILGGEGTRRYLLVVQNNAESRATGGFIGSYGILTAENGDVSVGRLLRTASWNDAVAASPEVTAEAPSDYHARYDQFGPARTLQNVNLSPDFPSVAELLMSLAPEAGVGPVDGVLAVDPFGLAALMELTGPVRVEGWPTDVTAGNVVDVTLQDAYAFFEATPERAEFLGDVAEVVVDEATTGTLGEPAEIARVLGRAGREGHLILAFARPEEQEVAEQLDLTGRVEPVRSDAVQVTTSNAAANKIDYYLQRNVNYRVQLEPTADGSQAVVSARLTVQLENAAPAEGLPRIVIGPYIADRFQAGENRAFVSLYSPLRLEEATLDGQPAELSTARERDRNVYSLFTSIPARTTQQLTADFGGVVRLLPGGWYELDLGRQPTVLPDRASISVEVADGWRIAEVHGLERQSDRVATLGLVLEEPARVRVRLVPAASGWDLWGRLRAGS